MPKANSNGIQLEFEATGPVDGEAVLFIMGFGAQLTRWPESLHAGLAARGYRVIRFDNRDVGLSERLDGAPIIDGAELAARRSAGLPLEGAYTLEDMADDAAGLLRHLGIPRAHVVGASMGAMIAQILAANYTESVISLVSIMSPAASPSIPLNKPDFVGNPALPSDGADIDALVESQLVLFQALAGPSYPASLESLREGLRRDLKRSFYPEGILRQGKAIGACHDRRDKLRRIVAPTLVMQGEFDPVVPIEAAYDIAQGIVGAELEIVPGMGHDFPEPLIPGILESILRLFQRARAVPPNQGITS